MGRSAAIAYAGEGADVAINYLPAEEPDGCEAFVLVRDAARKALALAGDLRDEAFCRHLATEALDGLGGLYIVVCKAGRQHSCVSILDISTEDFHATMKMNIYAPFWIIKAALRHLQPGSAIIGTTSEQAYDPSPDLYDYAQSKAATMNYLKSLAKQLGPKGVEVNGVAPGPIWTPLQISGGRLRRLGRHVRRDRAARASRTARGVGRHQCAPRRTRRHPHHWQHLWRRRRPAEPAMLNQGPRTSTPQAFAQSAAKSDGYEVAAAQLRWRRAVARRCTCSPSRCSPITLAKGRRCAMRRLWPPDWHRDTRKWMVNRCASWQVCKACGAPSSTANTLAGKCWRTRAR